MKKLIGLVAFLASTAHADTLDVAAASPNGLYYDSGSGTLYIADEASSTLIPYQDKKTGAPVALPAGSKPGLGAVVRLSDGTLVVSRFGHGESGAVLAITKGEARVVPGLDVKRRRIGLAPAPGGGVFSAWFGKIGDKEEGGVTRVNLSGGEKDVASGLGKVVGLAASGDSLYLGDQSAGAVLRCKISDCTHPETVAKIAGPDLMTPAPDGAVLVASRKGGATLVCPDGTTKSVLAGEVSTRGIAYDEKGDRVFVVEHGGGKSTIRVEPAHLGAHPCKKEK